VGATPWRFESSSPHQLLLFRINHLVSIALAAGLLLGQKIAALSCRIVAALADTLKREFERLGKQTGQFFGGGHGAVSIWCGRSSCNLESSFATRSHGHMACGLLSMRVLRPRDPARDCRHRLSAPHARKFASVWRSTGEPRNLSGRGYADPDHTGKPEFFSLPAPDDDEIARVAAATARRIIRLLERRGLLSDYGDAAEDALQNEEPLLAECAAASLQYPIATGSRTGKPVMRLGDRIEAEMGITMFL
jgi:hypothetical protein